MRVGATQAFPVRVPAEAAGASQATETAEAARGKYFKLPKTSEGAIAELTSGAINQMK